MCVENWHFHQYAPHAAGVPSQPCKTTYLHYFLPFCLFAGDIVTVANVLSEQEAWGLESLVRCVNRLLPQELPFYEIREFDTSNGNKGLYDYGGNICTFVQGLVQLYLPGVAATLYNAVDIAYEYAEWGEHDFPKPHTLGLRTLEHLVYNHTGRLGTHTDGDSTFTISIALADPGGFEGGHFRLMTEEALFKVPRLTGIVFLSESYHGITQVLGGTRKVFVAEVRLRFCRGLSTVRYFATENLDFLTIQRSSVLGG